MTAQVNIVSLLQLHTCPHFYPVQRTILVTHRCNPSESATIRAVKTSIQRRIYGVINVLGRDWPIGAWIRLSATTDTMDTDA